MRDEGGPPTWQSWQPAMVQPVGGGRWNGLAFQGDGPVKSVRVEEEA